MLGHLRSFFRGSASVERIITCKLSRSRMLRVESLEERRLLAIMLSGVPDWIEQGPGPITGGQTVGITNNPVTGAIHTIAAHPTDADILFAGGVNGGVWRTTDSTAANPSWTPLTDQFASLSIGAMELNPSNANVLLAGIGGFASGGFDVLGAPRGDQIGALFTTNALDPNPTFQLLTDDIANQNISGVAARDNFLMVAGTNGVYRSTDNGINFDLLSGLNNLPVGSVFDMVGDPGNLNRLYVGGTFGVFTTADASVASPTWTNVTDALMPIGGTTNNIEMAVHNSAGNNVVYVGVVNSGQLSSLTWSTDQGTDWTAMDIPRVLTGSVGLTGATNATPIVITSNNHGLNSTDQVRISGVTGNTAANGDFFITVINNNTFSLNGSAGNGNYAGGGTWAKIEGIQPTVKPGSQGRIHFSIAADPNSPNMVYIGGDRQDNPFPNSIGATDFTANLMRGDRSVAPNAAAVPSPQWTAITDNFAAGNSSPHADSREIVFDANDNMVEADDGGVYRRSNPTSNAGGWTSVNGDLLVGQFWSIAMDTVNDVIFGGLQDTGTAEQSAANNTTFTQITKGDGFFQAVDNTSTANQSIRYSLGNTFATFRRRVFDNANALQSNTLVMLAAAATPGTARSGLNATDQAQGASLNPIALNAIDARLMLIGATGVYEDNNSAGNAGDIIATITPAGITGRVRALAYGGRRGGTDFTQIAYVGTTTGQVFVRGETGGFNLRTTGGAGQIDDVILDPDDWQTAYVLQGSQVFLTTDGGQNFTDITGNLSGGGGQLSSELRSLGLYDPTDGTTDGNEIVLAGGRGGMYRLTGGTWSEYGTTLPNSVVEDFQVYDDTLVVGTYGRGAWTVADVSLTIDDPGILTICGDEQFANQDDTFLLIRDPNNPSQLQVFVNGDLEFSGPLAPFQQINVYGAGGNDNLIVDSTNGLINVPDGIRYNGDDPCPDQIGAGIGGFDSLTLLQTGGPTHISDTYSIGATNGSGTSVIVGAGGGGTQTVFFEKLEPVVNVVPALTLIVDATPESNAINYTAGPNSGVVNVVNPAGDLTGQVTVDNYESMEFANKANLTINSEAGGDTINLNNPITPTGLTTITVNGNDPTASDTVIVNGTAAPNNIVLTGLSTDGAVVTGAQAVPVTITTAEHLIIHGQNGGDSFTYTTPTGRDVVVFTPGTSPNSGTIFGTDLTAPGASIPFLPVAFTNLGLNSTVAIADAGGARTDVLHIYGTEATNVFDVNSGGAVQITTAGTFQFIQTPGVSELTLHGLGGNDVFNVPGNHPFGTVGSIGITIEGGDPSTGDVFNFTGAGAAITAELLAQVIRESGFANVQYGGVEQVNINTSLAGLEVFGTFEDDSLTYTPTGVAAGNFSLDGLGTNFSFSNLGTSVFAVDLRADTADEVIVLGTNNHDVITVDSPNRRVDVENVAGIVLAPIVLAATVEAVTVRSRLGNDTILVVPAPGTAGNLSVFVDGGAPSASDALVLAGALTRPNANSPVTNVTQFNAATDFVVQYNSLAPNEGRFRVFRNAVAMPDISYVDIEIVSPIVDPNPDPNTGDPRLLILGPDEHEANETRANAAYLGSGSVINVSNLSIFPDATEHRFVPADEDYFRVVAQKTGTLDFQVYFRMFPTNLLPAGGNINIEVLDSDGTVIAGTLATNFGTPDGDPDARVRIPVVAGQSYYLHVFGGNADGTDNPNVVNGYDLTVLNEGPPTPYDLELRDVIDASTIDASTSTTQFSGGAGLVPVNDFYNGKDLVFLSGANIGRRVRILDYVGATGDFVVQGGVLVAAPTVGNVFQIESHDTGSSQLDDYTRDNTPLIFFRLDDAIFLQDLPGNATPDSPPDEVIPIPFVTSQLAVPPAGAAGYRVAIFDNGDSDPQNPDSLPQVPVGYARKVADGIYVFDFDTDALSAPFTLTDGSHFLSARVQMIDPATPKQTGWGPRSVSLEIVVDSATPPVFFGDAAVAGDGLHPDSDSHVPGDVQPQNDFDDNQNINTRSDRVTNDTTPTFWGMAEADSTIRLYLDMNNNTTLELDQDLLLGLAVAIPDGTNQFPFGQWTLNSNVDMNRSDIVAALGRYDGLRTIYATAEDLAGNTTEPIDAARLNIFIDTQGPQITGVEVAGVPDYDLFDPKPSENGFTPLVNALTINVRDLPNRSNVDSNFLYQALVENIAEAPGNFLLVGDHVGTIAIQSIVWVPDPFPALNGQPAMGSLTLTFFSPLPDDRYTLTIRDSLVDPANNQLDGESNASEPQEDPTFPSGDGVPGGDFVARFTVDSRPEIGASIPQGITIDINGNFVWDPANAQVGNDATNVDLAFELAAFENGALIPGGLSVHDLVVVGRFTAQNAENLPERLFDQLASYGNYNGVFRWLIDFDSDGVVYGNGDPDGVDDLIVNQGTLPGFNSTARAGAIPVAGNFDRSNANGDEIGLYYAGIWALDTNHDFILDRVFTGNLNGAPIIGDFDGDGNDDLAVFNNNEFFFDLSFNPLVHTTANNDAKIIWGFPGVLDRPVAADMDQDGIDDIGLWVPRNGPQPERIIAEWYFLISGDFEPSPLDAIDNRLRITGQVNTLNHPFSPVPFGFDLFAEFGDELALPIVGNFDPPVASGAVPHDGMEGDYNHDLTVDMADHNTWKATFGSTTNMDADGNNDGRINIADYTVWRDRKGQASGTLAASASASAVSAELTEASSDSSVSFAESTFSPVAYFVPDTSRSLTESPAPYSFAAPVTPDSDKLLLLEAVWSEPNEDETRVATDGGVEESDDDSDYGIQSLDDVFASLAL